MSAYLCDSCFIIALADSSEAKHAVSCRHLDSHKLGHYYLLPYPSMFEILSQRMVDNSVAMARLEKIFLKNPEVNVVYISDSSYRQQSLSECVNDPRNIERHLSFVDTIIRNMVKSKNIRKDALITFNEEDFRDVCTQNKVKLVSL